MAKRNRFSKSKLKRMYLRVLLEMTDGSLKGYSWMVKDIVPYWINRYFEVVLFPEEEALALEAVRELERSGIVVSDAAESSDASKVFTEEGKKIVEKKGIPRVFTPKLEEMVKNRKLLSCCLDSFNNESYETAVFSAFKLVEEMVRAKARLGASDIGVDLMSRAFNARNGLLVVPDCSVPAEQEGVHSLFRGAIAFFKNPCSHRTVDYDDRRVVAQIISFADLLLEIVESSKFR